MYSGHYETELNNGYQIEVKFWADGVEKYARGSNEEPDWYEVEINNVEIDDWQVWDEDGNDVDYVPTAAEWRDIRYSIKEQCECGEYDY